MPSRGKRAGQKQIRVDQEVWDLIDEHRRALVGMGLGQVSMGRALKHLILTIGTDEQLDIERSFTDGMREEDDRESRPGERNPGESGQEPAGERKEDEKT